LMPVEDAITKKAVKRYLTKLFSDIFIIKKIPGPKRIRSGDFPFLSSESFG
jgi:hypothetical protein